MAAPAGASAAQGSTRDEAFQTFYTEVISVLQCFLTCLELIAEISVSVFIPFHLARPCREKSLVVLRTACQCSSSVS